MHLEQKDPNNNGMMEKFLNSSFVKSFVKFWERDVKGMFAAIERIFEDAISGISKAFGGLTCSSKTLDNSDHKFEDISKTIESPNIDSKKLQDSTKETGLATGLNSNGPKTGVLEEQKRLKKTQPTERQRLEEKNERQLAESESKEQIKPAFSNDRTFSTKQIVGELDAVSLVGIPIVDILEAQYGNGNGHVESTIGRISSEVSHVEKEDEKEEIDSSKAEVEEKKEEKQEKVDETTEVKEKSLGDDSQQMLKEAVEPDREQIRKEFEAGRVFKKKEKTDKNTIEHNKRDTLTEFVKPKDNKKESNNNDKITAQPTQPTQLVKNIVESVEKLSEPVVENEKTKVEEKRIFLSNGEEGTYSGDVVNDKPHGEGELRFNNVIAKGKFNKGDFVKGHVENFQCKYGTFSGEVERTGEFVKGKGVFTSKDGTIYEGEIENLDSGIITKTKSMEFNSVQSHVASAKKRTQSLNRQNETKKTEEAYNSFIKDKIKQFENEAEKFGALVESEGHAKMHGMPLTKDAKELEDYIQTLNLKNAKPKTALLEIEPVKIEEIGEASELNQDMTFSVTFGDQTYELKLVGWDKKEIRKIIKAYNKLYPEEKLKLAEMFISLFELAKIEMPLNNQKIKRLENLMMIGPSDSENHQVNILEVIKVVDEEMQAVGFALFQPKERNEIILKNIISIPRLVNVLNNLDLDTKREILKTIRILMDKVKEGKSSPLSLEGLAEIETEKISIREEILTKLRTQREEILAKLKKDIEALEQVFTPVRAQGRLWSSWSYENQEVKNCISTLLSTTNFSDHGFIEKARKMMESIEKDPQLYKPTDLLKTISEGVENLENTVKTLEKIVKMKERSTFQEKVRLLLISAIMDDGLKNSLGRFWKESSKDNVKLRELYNNLAIHNLETDLFNKNVDDLMKLLQKRPMSEETKRLFDEVVAERKQQLDDAERVEEL